MISFKYRLLILIVALIALAQGVTVGSVLIYRDSAVRQEATRELTHALDVVRWQLDGRGEQLRAAAEVLVADFGFKTAVASGEQATIRPALMNQAQRIGASVAAYYDSGGRVVAAVSPDLHPNDWQGLKVLDAATRREHWTLAIIDGQPVQLVVSELRAPGPIGWVVLGFAVNVAVVHDLSKLVDLQVSFVAYDSTSSDDVAVSTLTGDKFDALLKQFRHGATAAHASVLRLAGHDYLGSSSDLPALNGHVRLIVHRPLADAEAPYREMRAALVLIAGGALLGAVGIGLFAGSGAVRPLRRLVEAAQRIERGDYERRVESESSVEFEHVAHAFNAMQDGIREREVRIAHHAHRARHDQLTGLPNRLALQEELTTVLAGATPTAVVLLDVLRFRDVNTSLGFHAGDRLLKELGTWLKRNVPGVSSVARVGADQFGLILPQDGASALAVINTAAAKLHYGAVDSGSGGLKLDGLQLTLEICAGVSAAAASAQGAEDLLRQAYIALEEAKERGQSAVLFHSKHDIEHRRRVLLVGELRQAIERDMLRLEYQPLVYVASRQLSGFEALVRWTHAELGPISPAEFVPLAERAGSVGDLTRWVLGAAIAQLGAWQQRGFAGKLSVNLSASDVIDPVLPARVLKLLQRHGVDPRGLLFEVTESAMMREADKGVAMMQQLKRAGVHFAIDDFGTGYSSLAQLQRLPVDELKIDKAFVAGLDSDPGKQVIVHSTTQLAHGLGLQVVAEGVETAEVWSSLVAAGCDLAQGYLISRPLPAAEVMDWLARHQQTVSGTLFETGSRPRVVDIKSRSH